MRCYYLLALFLAVVNACPPGSQGGIGPPGLVWTGGLNATATYTYASAVYFSGSAYVCIVDTCAGSATPTSSPLVWSLLARQGSQGNQGLPGTPGAQGPIGNTGPAGSLGQLSSPPDNTLAIGGAHARYTAGYFVNVYANNSVNAKTGLFNNVALSATTASTTPTTGALTVAGGVGINGGLNVFGAVATSVGVTVGASLSVAGSTTHTGAVSITSGSISGSPTSGALVVNGGVGVGGSINCAGSVQAVNLGASGLASFSGEVTYGILSVTSSTAIPATSPSILYAQVCAITLAAFDTYLGGATIHVFNACGGTLTISAVGGGELGTPTFYPAGTTTVTVASNNMIMIVQPGSSFNNLWWTH